MPSPFHLRDYLPYNSVLVRDERGIERHFKLIFGEARERAQSSRAPNHCFSPPFI
jgi:hypothetical protein